MSRKSSTQSSASPRSLGAHCAAVASTPPPSGVPQERALRFGNLTFKVADSREISQALELRSRIYLAELGHDGIDRFDDVADHLIACEPGGEIVAALRIVGPAHRPFDMECLVDLAPLLPPDRSPAEMARMCVHPERRRMQKDHLIHLGMLKFCVAFGRKHGITDFVALILPHHLNLYRIALFAPLCAPRSHPTWGTVYPMRLDLLELQAKRTAAPRGMARLLLADSGPPIVV